MGDPKRPGTSPETRQGRTPVQPLRVGDAEGIDQPGRPVSRLRKPLPAPKSERESDALPPLPARQRAPGAEAVREAFAPLDYGGEAPRIGLIGNTGSGKTRAAEALAVGYLERSPGPVIVVDNKSEGRYDHLPGAMVFPSVSAFASSPPPNGCRVWIFKPDICAGGEIDPEEIAKLQWNLAAKRWPSLVLNDELYPHAARNGQWRRGMRELPRAFVQGRVKGLAQCWGTTMLQAVPVEAAEQSSELWVFKTAGLGVRIVSDRNYLIGVPPGTIEGLAGYPLPPQQRGEFVRLISGVPWDGRVYKF